MQQADRLILNVLSNYLLTLVAGVAGLVMVPVVLGELGAAGYGLAALLQAAFVGVQTLSDGMSRTLQRFVPQDLASGDPQRVNETFSSAMVWFAVLGLLGASLVWGFQGFYLDVPGVDAARLGEARIALVLVIAALALGSFLNAYRAGLESLQRYDLLSLRVGAMTALRALLVIALFELGHGSISLFVGSHLAATALSGIWCRAALRREMPQLRASLRSVRRRALSALALFSAGVMLIVAGNLLGTEGFRLVVGNMLGMREVGMLSALLAFRTMASTLIENMSNVVTPVVSALEARGASNRVGTLLVSSTKYASVAAALVCVVPLAVASSFLSLWLGAEAVPFAPVMFAILVGQIPTIVSASAQQLVVGLGDARLSGTTVAVRGVASLTAALLYLVMAPAPTLFGATVCLYVVQAVGGIAMLAFAARATRIGAVALFRDGLLRPLALACLAAGVTALGAHWVGSSTWTELVICLALGETAFVILVGWIGLDQTERRRLQDFALRTWKWARRAGA